LFRQFAAALIDCGYRVHHRVFEARHCDSCQHRERLFIVAIRSGAEELLGAFEFPSPNTASRSARSVLVPLPIFEGERLSCFEVISSLPPPLSCSSGCPASSRSGAQLLTRADALCGATRGYCRLSDVSVRRALQGRLGW
jgi:site-specific DNA-cytosine methylase